MVAGCNSGDGHSVAVAHDAAVDAPSEPDDDSGEPEPDDDSGQVSPQYGAVVGSAVGLEGSGLILQVNGGNDFEVKQNGSVTLRAQELVGQTLRVTVAQQPTAPSQTCSVSPAELTVKAAGTQVEVQCVTNTYHVGGTVTGVQGAGLILRNNAGDPLTISANGSFVFPTSVKSGATFTVSVGAQPSHPSQTCSVSGASGSVGAGHVTSVTVNCTTNTYTIAGSIEGLVGSGLVLQNNAGHDLSVTSNGTFAFATPLASGTPFAVTVKTQPSTPVQTCVVSSASGEVTSADVSSVGVVCTTNKFPVAGSVTGLSGSGLVLQNNLDDDLSVAADGTFAFGHQIESGSVYSVSVLSQPTSPSQTCHVTLGQGSIVAAGVSNVEITCTTNTYAVGGTVVGLEGTGLKLRNNGGNELSAMANGSFSFSQPVASGTSYAVTVQAQPSGPLQSCTVSAGTGNVVAGPVSSVVVNCSTTALVVAGTVTGLSGSGLALKLNDGSALPINANGGFAFPNTVPSGAAYTVQLTQQPNTPWQTCSLTGATGTMGNTGVDSVVVSCATNSYTVGGSVTGLHGSGLTLRNNGGDDLALSADGSFTFANAVTSGQGYTVSIKDQPTNPWQTCVISNGAGVVGGANLSNVSVTCSTNMRMIHGTVSGLLGTLVLQNNGADPLTVTANGIFMFAQEIESGQPYAVAVRTQPATPSQTCSVTQGSGTVANADVEDVSVTCTTNRYAVSATVSGLAGSGLVLTNNGGDDVPVSASGAVNFPTSVASGQPYLVAVKTQPTTPTQTCSVVGGSGSVGGGNVTSVSVNCTTNRYLVGGTVSGLFGTGLVLQNNLGDDLPVSGSGTFSFATSVASSGAYAVTVKTQPSSPWQTCTVSGGASGGVTNANISSVQVSCTFNDYAVAVNVSGLSGSGLVLQNNAGDNLAVGADGTHTFATRVLSGQAYSVSVLTPPQTPSQTCSVAAASGLMAGANVTLNVTCSTDSFSIMGTISGLVGTVVLRNNGGDDLTVSANGHIMFDTAVLSGNPYAVTVYQQPSTMSCWVSSGSGTVGNAHVADVIVTCGRILFVDDDRGDPGETTWLAGLTAAGYSYDYEVIAASGNPVADLSLYRLVIWSIGERDTGNLTALNVTTLTTFLNLGGRSLLYGGAHSLYSENAAAAFITNYLGVATYTNNMPQLSTPSSIAVGVGGPLQGQNYTWRDWPGVSYGDMLSAWHTTASTATALLQVSSDVQNYNAAAKDIITLNNAATFKAMTWGIDLNHIDSAQRQQLLNDCLSLLLN